MVWPGGGASSKPLHVREPPKHAPSPIEPRWHPLLDRCATLAIEGIPREFPCKFGHLIRNTQDIDSLKALTPIFFGCFDWHSAVHNHWLLVRLSRLLPGRAWGGQARRILSDGFTEAKAQQEYSFLKAPGHEGFERPYGLAWLLLLCQELYEWDTDSDAKSWLETLKPLERLARERFFQWLPQLSHPVRSGEHSQTAFALGLVWDWAKKRGDTSMLDLLSERVGVYYLEDANWNFDFEPSGQDFLSPGLAEADLLRRILSFERFSDWQEQFIPSLRGDAPSLAMEPLQVTNPTDGKLVHLAGLNLSRAWMLEAIAGSLPAGSPKTLLIDRLQKEHRNVGLRYLPVDSYAGSHWLGSFVVYLLTRRGL